MNYSKWDKINVDDEDDNNSNAIDVQKLKYIKTEIDESFEKAQALGDIGTYHNIIQQYQSLFDKFMYFPQSNLNLEVLKLAISCLLNVVACYSKCAEWKNCISECNVILNHIKNYENILLCSKNQDTMTLLVHTYYFRAFAHLKVSSEIMSQWNYYLEDYTELLKYRNKFNDQTIFDKLLQNLHNVKEGEIEKCSTKIKNNMSQIGALFLSKDNNVIENKLQYIANIINDFSVMSSSCTFYLFHIHYILAKVYESSKDYFKVVDTVFMLL